MRWIKVGALTLFSLLAKTVGAQAGALSYPLVSGCYFLVVGDWDPSLQGDNGYHAFPRMVSLDTSRASRGGRVLTPDISYPSPHRFPGVPRWEILGDTVRMLWSNGFSPTLISLRRVDDHLEGYAEALSDAIPAGKPKWPRAAVKANKTKCFPERQRYRDSLTAGRRRRANAGITEYRIRTRVDCFCIYFPGELDLGPPVFTVRNGVVTSRSEGRPRSPVLTVDSLFDLAERDLGDPESIVTQFRLDPEYGFLREYHSEMPSIPDAWIGIKVDSFAVVSRLPGRANSKLEDASRRRIVVGDGASRRVGKSCGHQLSIERVDQIEIEAKRRCSSR